MNIRYVIIILLFPINLFSQTFDFDIEKKEACNSLTTKLINLSSDTVNYKFEWKWGTQISNFVTNVYADFGVGTHEISLTVKNLSGNQVGLPIKKYVTVHRNPFVKIVSDKLNTCIQNPINFSIDSISSDMPITKYQWIFGDGTVSLDQQPEPHYYSIAGTYITSVIVTDANNCSSGQSQPISVNISTFKPQASFSVNQDASCKNELQVVFTNTTTPASGMTITGYEWKFGDNSSTSTQQNESHLYKGYGSYVAQLTVFQSNGCTDVFTKGISLSELSVSFVAVDMHKPDDVISKENTLKACLGDLIFVSTGVNADSFSWDIGNDGSAEFSGVGMQLATIGYSFTQPGTYPVKLTAGNSSGCQGEYIDTIEVEGQIEFSEIQDSLFSCDPLEMHDLSVTVTPSVDQIVWLLDNSMSLATNVTTFQTQIPEGIHSLTISVMSENKCPGNLFIERYIEVLPPKAFLTDISRNSGCIPLNVSFAGTSTYVPEIGNDVISKQEWDFNGDNVVDLSGVNSGSYNFTTTGTFSAKYTVTTQKGCKSSASAMIFTGDQTPISYSITPELCAWDDAEFKQLTNLDKTSYLDTIWFSVYSEDDTTRTANEMEPISPPGEIEYVHFDDTTGYFRVAVRASDHGCRTKWQIDNNMVFVKGPIVKLDKKIDCKNPYDIEFLASKLVDVDSISWSIFKYDGIYPYFNTQLPIPTYTLETLVDQTTYPFNYTFTARGDYRAQIICKSYSYPECADTSVLEWVPVRELKMDFELADYTVCQGDIVQFSQTDTTNAQDMIATRVACVYGANRTEGVVTSQENKIPINYTGNSYVYYSSSGQARVLLYGKDVNECVDTISKPLTVFKPQAGFKLINPTNCLPFTVGFEDTTKSVVDIVEREWSTQGDTASFGTGNRLSVSDVISTIGAKSPVLTVTDIHGCTDTYVVQDGIIPIVPDARFSVVESKICVGGKATLSLPTDNNPLYTKDVDSIEWYFDNVIYKTTSKGQIPDPYIFTTPGNKIVFTKSYKTSPTGEMCENNYSLTKSVKDIKIKLPFDGTNLCKELSTDAILWLGDTVYTGMDDVKSIKWYIDNVYYPTSNKYATNLRLPKVGSQNVKMIVETDYSGCALLRDSIDVNVYNRNVAITLSKTAICVGDQVTLNLSDQSFLGTVPHYWLLGNGDRLEGTGASVNYTYKTLPDVQNLIVKFKVDSDAKENSSSCTDIESSANLKIYPVEVNFDRGVGDTQISGCAPFTVSFINTSEGDSTNKYTWNIDTISSQEVNPTYTFSTPDKTFDIKLALSSSTCTQTLTKTITTLPNPELTVSADKTVVCDFDNVQITASGDFAKLDSWKWGDFISPVKTTVLNQVFDTSQYVIATVLSSDGCSAKDSILIRSQYKPYFTGAPEGGLLYYFSEDSSYVVYDDKAKRLIVNETFNFNNDSLPGVSYRWNPTTYLNCKSCASPDIILACGEGTSILNCLEYPDALSYNVYMSDSLGCYTNIEKKIDFEILKNTKLGMPTAFSPNGDGLNDVAYARGWAVVNFIDMKIYNRWGQVIFETTDMNVGWDGTFNNESQGVGSYAYIIRGLDTTGEELVVKGFISLLK